VAVAIGVAVPTGCASEPFSAPDTVVIELVVTTDDQVESYLARLQADVTPSCGPYESRTNTGATQTYDPAARASAVAVAVLATATGGVFSATSFNVSRSPSATTAVPPALLQRAERAYHRRATGRARHRHNPHREPPYSTPVGPP
jgi:hypothetical protein